MPVPVSELTIRDGEFHYRDYSTSPVVDVPLYGVQGQISNLLNTTQDTSARYAQLNFSGRLYNHAELMLEGHFDVLDPKPNYLIKLAILQLQMDSLNPILEAYTTLIIQGGVVTMGVDYDAHGGQYACSLQSRMAGFRITQLVPKLKKGLQILGQSIKKEFNALIGADEKDDVFDITVHYGGSIAQDDNLGLRALGNAIGQGFTHRLMPAIEDSLTLRNVVGRRRR